MEPNKPGAQLQIPGIALVLLVLGVFVFSENPLKPTRPDKLADHTPGAEQVRARLWQDPFAAVKRHHDQWHKAEATSKGIGTASKIQSHSRYTDRQHRVCRSAGAEGYVNPTDNREMLRQVDRAHGPGELRCQVQRDTPHDGGSEYDLHALAVMVPGGPYPEEQETRIRSRYAVISGLANSGYTPVDPEHVGYLDLAKLCDAAMQNGSVPELALYCDLPATIPYEWFNSNENTASDTGADRYANRVLVLWLDDDTVSRHRPLYLLDQLRRELTPEVSQCDGNDGCRRIRFDVLGPSNSTSLVTMYREARKPEFAAELATAYAVSGTRFISPRATIDETALSRILGDPAGAVAINWFAPLRTVSTDDRLVDALLCELLRRGINPFFHDPDMPDSERFVKACAHKCSNVPAGGFNRNSRQDHIVLIGEWDTVYSRNYNMLFRSAIGDDPDPEPAWLHSFNYFRGIDGSIGGSGNLPEGGETNDGGQKKKGLRRPVGENQFDYLRRLGQQLEALSDSIRDTGTIRAIGIVGTDTYDKLLVLQSLRKRFPGVVFFTTDLDARMIQREENEWARNLLVASGYGLEPDVSDFSGLVFRDNYQTALYLSTRKATRCNKSGGTCAGAISDYLPPVNLFEIGNRGAVDYTPAVRDEEPEAAANANDAGGNAAGPLRALAASFADPEDYLLAFLSCMLLLVLMLRLGMPASLRYAIFWFGIASLTAAALTINTYLLLSILFVLLLVYQTSNITRTWIAVTALVVYALLYWLYSYDLSASIEYTNFATGTSIWPAVVLRMNAAVLSLLFILFALGSLRANTNSMIERFDPAEGVFIINHGLAYTVCKYLEDSTPSLQKPAQGAARPAGGNHSRKGRIRWLGQVLMRVSDGAIRVVDSVVRGLFDTCLNTFRRKYYKPAEVERYSGVSVWPRLIISLWGWRYQKNARLNINELVYQYMLMSGKIWTVLRVLSMVGLYMFLTFQFIDYFPERPFAPFSGAVSASAHMQSLRAAVFLYVLLIFLVVDITRLNARFVELLTRCDIVWPKAGLADYRRKYGVSAAVATEEMKIRLVIQRSKAVDVLIFLPFVVLSLMILSRSTYFDHWDMPLHLAFIILLGALIALSSAIRLRRSAKHARKVALKKLERYYREHLYTEVKHEAGMQLDNVDEQPRNGDGKAQPRKRLPLYERRMSERIRRLIEDIESINEGPFVPITSHPIVQAVAMPFGGVGGLYLIEMLAKTGV